ncbi:MAG: hypothetical protein R6V35_04855 [Candidatus Nanohaloarchaea archaeon]
MNKQIQCKFKMALQNLIKESAEELRERPSLFAPKILTSIVGSIWMLFLLEASKTMNMSHMLLGLAFFPLIFFLGVLSPVIVAEMIKNDYKLKKGVLQTLDYIPKLLLTSLILIIVLTAALLPAYIGLGVALLYGSYILLIIGLPITMIAAGMIVYGIYFLPITLTENSALDSFKESFKASGENKREVAALVLFSFVLLGITYRATGTLEILGAAGFILGRILSSIVSTYTVTLSPKYYIEK